MYKTQLPHKLDRQQIDVIVERLFRKKHQSTRMLKMLCKRVAGCSIDTFYRELDRLNLRHKLQGRKKEKPQKRKRKIRLYTKRYISDGDIHYIWDEKGERI